MNGWWRRRSDGVEQRACLDEGQEWSFVGHCSYIRFQALAHVPHGGMLPQLLAWSQAHGIYRGELLGKAKMDEWAYLPGLVPQSSTAASYSGVVGVIPRHCGLDGAGRGIVGLGLGLTTKPEPECGVKPNRGASHPMGHNRLKIVPCVIFCSRGSGWTLLLPKPGPVGGWHGEECAEAILDLLSVSPCDSTSTDKLSEQPPDNATPNTTTFTSIIRDAPRNHSLGCSVEP